MTVPVERIAVSVSHLCELVGVDPQRFVAIERDEQKREGAPADRNRLWLVLEPEEQMAQGSGVFPALNQGGKRKPKGGGKKC